MSDNFVITIARGFGTGGKKIASELASELGINCYEHRILTLASRYSDVPEHEFYKVDERLRGGFLTNVIKNIPRIMAVRPETHDFKGDMALFGYQKKIIEDLAKTESCVIVGKCADYILADQRNVISIYIEAPREYCVNRISRQMNLSDDEASKIIAKTDKYRAEYYKYYTGGRDWTNPTNYDLVLNPEKVGHHTCVKVIKDYVETKLHYKETVDPYKFSAD